MTFHYSNCNFLWVPNYLYKMNIKPVYDSQWFLGMSCKAIRSVSILKDYEDHIDTRHPFTTLPPIQKKEVRCGVCRYLEPHSLYYNEVKYHAIRISCHFYSCESKSGQWKVQNLKKWKKKIKFKYFYEYKVHMSSVQNYSFLCVRKLYRESYIIV